MSSFTDELILLCRHYGFIERDAVCCGTVSVPQCLALQLLRDAPLDISTLAMRAGSSVSAMTRLVDGLERRGWSERQRDPADRRRAVVALTEPGASQAEALRRQTEALAQQLLGAIPPEKHAQVVESLRLVREAMDRVSNAIACCGPPGT